MTFRSAYGREVLSSNGSAVMRVVLCGRGEPGVWVQDAGRVQHRLEPALKVDGARVQFLVEPRPLGDPDPVLSGDRAAQREGSPDQFVGRCVQPGRWSSEVGGGSRRAEHRMEVSVADVRDHGAGHLMAPGDLADRSDRGRQGRAGYRDVLADQPVVRGEYPPVSAQPEVALTGGVVGELDATS